MVHERYVALGDSFTEGVGDPDPARPHGLRGWADRVAEVLEDGAHAAGHGFGYANLAIRGRTLRPILAEQLEPALGMAPDLVTLHAGANDVLRPRVDLDALAAAYDAGVARLGAAGARVVLFTTWDPGGSGIYGPLRGRMAIFNEHVREISDRHGTGLVDMWRMREQPVGELMDTDRMHLNARGHDAIARAVLATLDVPHTLPPPEPFVAATPSRRQQLRSDAAWTREFLVPWVHRRLTGRSSGDGLSARRPVLRPVLPPDPRVG